MISPVFDIDSTRQLFSAAIPEDLFATDLLELRYLYVPNSHFRALQPDAMLVEGIRGAGKSLWWKSLQNQEHRQLVDKVANTQLGRVKCLAGFGGEASDNYPNSAILQQLCQKFDAFPIWYSIVVWNLLRDTLDLLPGTTWQSKVEWVQNNLDVVEKALLKKDAELRDQDQILLVLFDALDRSAQDWQVLRKLLKGLLNLTLDFRVRFKFLRLKVFIRQDMLSDEVFAFPDGSKISQNKVSLEWSRADLYSLLWQYLGNEINYGQIFRDDCNRHFGQHWQEIKTDVWQIPKAMCTDEILQRKIFHALAGEWMGKDSRRGFPYTWLANHLGDGYGKVSPRSFLTALRVAAKNSHKSQQYPLDYEAIKEGVQEASSIRVNELKEDYPWVGELLRPLKGITLPCEFEQIQEKWSGASLLEKLQAQTQQDVRSLPSQLSSGCQGIKRDLEELGIFQTNRDGRINMPDVYRVGYGLGRKGGIKPIR